MTRSVSRAAAVAFSAVAVLAAGMSSAIAAPASPSANPSAAPSASPSASPTAGPTAHPNATAKGRSHTQRAVCTRGPGGGLMNCPAVVPAQKRPRGARNTARVSSPVTDLAAPTPAEFRSQIASGQLKLEMTGTRVLLGKMILAAFLASLHSRDFQEALESAQ